MGEVQENSKADQTLQQLMVDIDCPTMLFSRGDYAIYWLGITDSTAFRCNSYLICYGEQAILIDPGSSAHMEQIQRRVAQIMPITQVTAILLCHQDPDVAASFPLWLEVNPDACIITSPRAHVLLPHYGRSDYRLHDIELNPRFKICDEHSLQFISAPHLHSPAAFTTFDAKSGFLFSGDIWAALNLEWTLVCEDFAEHCNNMDLFHMDYMASNIAARGFVNKLDGLDIQAILPQHGSIIPQPLVADALNYLRSLRCGTDIEYPELS